MSDKISYRDGYSDAIEYALDLVEYLYLDATDGLLDFDELMGHLKVLIQDLHNAKENTNK